MQWWDQHCHLLWDQGVEDGFVNDFTQVNLSRLFEVLVSKQTVYFSNLWIWVEVEGLGVAGFAN